MSDPEIVGYLIDNGSRRALVRVDGTVSNKFGLWETREQIAAALAASGLLLRDDDSVVRA